MRYESARGQRKPRFVDRPRVDRHHPWAAGLKGAWLFNDGGVVATNLVGGPVGSLSGGAFYTVAAPGPVISTDGVNDYVTTNQTFLITTDFAVVVSVKLD